MDCKPAVILLKGNRKTKHESYAMTIEIFHNADIRRTEIPLWYKKVQHCIFTVNAL